METKVQSRRISYFNHYDVKSDRNSVRSTFHCPWPATSHRSNQVYGGPNICLFSKQLPDFYGH